MMDFTIENLTQIAIFHDIPDGYHDFILEEWRSHGITRLFFPGAIFHRALKEPEYGEAFIRKAEKHGIQLTDGHVPWTPEWALNTPEDFKDVMLENNRRALELLPYIVTCHLHDNNGLEDQHLPPGQGTIDWAELASALKKAPRLKSIQSETSLIQQDKVYSISAMTDIFREVVFSH